MKAAFLHVCAKFPVAVTILLLLSGLVGIGIATIGHNLAFGVIIVGVVFYMSMVALGSMRYTA